MAESLYRKLLIQENKRREEERKRLANIIWVADTVKKTLVYRARRTGDIVPTITVQDAININYHLQKFDGRFIWTKAEEIFDALAVPLETVTENQGATLIYFTKTVKGVYVDITFYYKQACTAIYKEETVQRIVGHNCQE